VSPPPQYICRMRNLNLLLSFRHFRRDKRSFFINLFGLSTGLACTILIYLWVWDEMSVDRFHQADAQLFQVQGNFDQGGEINTWNGTPSPLAEALQEGIPEIKLACGATDPSWQMEFQLTVDADVHTAIGKFVGERYFDLFSYPLLDEIGDSVLSKLNSVVVSASLARRLFGSSTEAIGKQLDWQFQQLESPAVVTGVFQDIPDNSTDQFDFVLPFRLYQKVFGGQWENLNAVAYVLLDEQASLSAVNEKVDQVYDQRMPDAKVDYFLQRYSEQYLHGNFENGRLSGGRINYVKWFSWLAIFILGIACINFVNLATAKSMQRSKQVGIRKAMGAGRWQLARQYLAEASLLSWISISIAVGIAYLFLPYFNQLSSKSIVLSFSWPLPIALFLIGLITTFLAGAYPAFYISSFPAIHMLKGGSKGANGGLSLRKVLVTFQFTLSIVLIVGVLVLSRQMDFLNSKSLGYERDNLIRFSMGAGAATQLESFMTEIKRLPAVEEASAMTNGFFQLPGGELSWDGQGDREVTFSRHIVDYGFVETLGIEVLDGRTFSPEFAEEPQIILNQKAVDAMGITAPVGKKAKFWGEDVTIVGVVEDFHFSSLHEAISPMFFQLSRNFLNDIIVRVNGRDIGQGVRELSEVYQRFNPGLSFDYHFVDEDYKSLYGAEERVASLGQYFALLAILISCLGLLGLVFFMAERRRKEISIRKILGSSIWELVRLLTKDFTSLVLLAATLAIPISFLAAKRWLLTFAYHIELHWGYFALAVIIGLALSWLTIIRQVLLAAKLNPAEVLRNE